VALIGIDFGTARIRDVLAPTEPARWPEEAVVPSIVVAHPQGLAVGVEAEQLAAASDGALRGVKRLLGRLPGDPLAEVTALRMGGQLVTAASQLAFRTANGVLVNVEEAAARLLAHAVMSVAGGVPADHQAVIAIPSWYEPAQESALGMACQGAGLDVLRLIEDAASMALALAFEERAARTVGFVNLGAGAVSVAFATLESKSVFVLSSVSDRRFGGDDLTEALLERALGAAAVDESARAECRHAVDQMKAELAAQGSAQRIVRGGAPAGERQLTLDAGAVDQAMAGLGSPLRAAFEEALEDAALEPDEVDEIYATGAMMAFPQAVDAVVAVTRRMPRCDESVERLAAHGAALQCAILAGGMDGPLVFDGKSTGSLNLSELS
jgi:molecular chaperone DnaK (HSP70)